MLKEEKKTLKEKKKYLKKKEEGEHLGDAGEQATSPKESESRGVSSSSDFSPKEPENGFQQFLTSFSKIVGKKVLSNDRTRAIFADIPRKKNGDIRYGYLYYVADEYENDVSKIIIALETEELLNDYYNSMEYAQDKYGGDTGGKPSAIRSQTLAEYFREKANTEPPVTPEEGLELIEQVKDKVFSYDSFVVAEDHRRA